SVEFFLNKNVTHFVTDKLQQPSAAVGETGEPAKELPHYCASPSGVTTSSNENLARHPVASPAGAVSGSTTPSLLLVHHRPQRRSSRQLLHLTHQQHTHGQYVNEYGPATSRTSSPCPPPITTTSAVTAAAASPSSSTAACGITTSGAAFVKQRRGVAGHEKTTSYSPSTANASVGFDGKVKPIHLSSSSLSTATAAVAAVPRSRADAMLQRVRQQQQQNQQQQQQQQQQHPTQPSYNLLHSSPLNPTLTYGSTPTKASTPSPFQSSSHHKQIPSPSCYSPSGAGAGNLGAAITTRTSAAASSRQNSPVHLARSWGTLVWSAEYALKFLRKVLSSLPSENAGSKSARSGTTDASGRPHRHHRHHHHHGSSSRLAQHVHHLRGRFLKIESRSAPGHYRPVYQEFKRWPVLLRTEEELAGRKAPFADVNEAPDRNQPADDQRRKGVITNEAVQSTPVVEGTSTSRMTRKLSSAVNNAAAAATGTVTTTTTVTKGKSGETGVKKRPLEKAAVPPPAPRDCGYCEICRIEYDSLAVHVQSESHQTFVQNDDNFLSLDRLLDSFGGGDEDSGGDSRIVEEDAEGGATAAVTVESFFQQLHNTTRLKRGAAGEELLYETNNKPLKAIEGEEREEEDGGQGRRKTTTVTVAVTTTTTAAADELIERQKAPIGDRITTTQQEEKAAVIKEEPNKSSTLVKEEKKVGVKVKRKRTKTVNERESGCSAATDSDGKEQQDISDIVQGKSKKELIKLALKSVIATFECSDSDFLAQVEKTLDSTEVDDSVVVDEVEENQSVNEQTDKVPRLESVVSDTSAANRHSLANCDSNSKEEVQKTEKVRLCRQQNLEAPAVSVCRRSDRISGGVGIIEKTAEREESSEGMFGRRSAIHHHPHNQLNHHNHQKHKSTLSALLLKQQQERAQQLLLERGTSAEGGEGRVQPWEDERKETDSSAVSDHAAGMKVLTNFRKQIEVDEDDDELVVEEDKSDSLATEATSTPIPSATEAKSAIGGGVPGRRKRNARTDATMGQKSSALAMNKHHHHHHMAHLNDSGVAGGGGTGAKTRHATELAATLLECDGLDPKNTKRISLGLRQNPKRANLNEDFTSLLDETLERSKTSTSSSSVKRGTSGRIRVLPKGKDQTLTTKQQQQQQQLVEDEKPIRDGCEDEEKEKKRETVDHDRVKPVTGSKRSKKTVTLEDIKVRGIRWRAPSPTNRPPVKSPLLYKVIDNQAGEDTISTSGGINTSSRSATVTSTAPAMLPSSGKDISSTAGSTNAEPSNSQVRSYKSAKLNSSSPGKKNGLIVKIRRVRQSELSLLNDEAENFMFPRKDDSSSEEETDDDRQTSSEGFQAGVGPNNYSIDITSSSEGDRVLTGTIKSEVRHSDEEDHAEVEEEAPAKTATSVTGSRKRKKAIPASANRAGSIESSDHRSSPVSSRASPAPTTVAPVVKRARLETTTRRKGQQLSADYGKGQDPVEIMMRFPEAPIQPCPVAAAATKTSPSSTDREDEDGHDAEQIEEDKEGVEEDEEEEEEIGKVEKEAFRKSRGRGSATRGVGRRGQRKAGRKDTVTSSATITAGLCPSCTAGISGRGGRRGRGRFSGRRGRRGVRGGARASHLQSDAPPSSCTCHLLDATRMPPPSSRRRTNESADRATTPIPSRKTGTRASKTKTTPPSAEAAVPSSSFASPLLASDGGSAIMAGSSLCGSYTKGKEDGMGAVFKWINFRKRCEEIEPYRFAFERVPSLEPWYETFQRQDDGTEKVYEYFGSTGYRKLPYEMGPLPALGQNCCILNYKVIASRKSNRTTSLQSSSFASMEPPSPGGGRKSSRPNSSDVQSFAGSASTANVEESESIKCSPSSSSLSSLPLKKRKLLMQQEGSSNATGSCSSKPDASNATSGEGSSNSSRIARLIAGVNERPRKSPREHASTLAILSLLQQQQHRKRAGTIKILTSPKKATTAAATAQTTSLLHEHQLLHQDADSNGEELSRSCSRASDRASSRAGSSNGGSGIKFDRPLFPDSSYVNSHTLCQELDAFLSDELNRVAGKKDDNLSASVALDGIVKKERSDTCAEVDGNMQEKEKCDRLPSLDEDLLDVEQEQLVLPPSVIQEGIAIERNELPVSKRDLLDVLQTVGTEPPLSLKLVQRCESVVKKVVQYDRKERPMVACGSGAGLAISSGSPVIGLQLFDSGSALAACGPGGGGPGGVGGSFLKKRINRTGWPTNKRKIGTRTRQQSRFMLPSLSTGKKSLSRESIKKEEPEEREGDETKGDEVSACQEQQKQCTIKREPKQKYDEGTEEEGDDNEDDEEEEDDEEGQNDENEEEEQEDEEDEQDDDTETVIEEKVIPRRARKEVAQANHKKTDSSSARRKQRDDERKEDHSITTDPKSMKRSRRKRSVGKRHEPSRKSIATLEHINPPSACDEEPHTEEDDDEESKAEEGANARAHDPKSTEEKRPVAPVVDSMPTLRAALMRDNSQLQRLLSSPPSKPSSISISSPSSIIAPGSFNRGTVPPLSIPGRGSAVTATTVGGGCESLLCQTSSSGGGGGPMLGVNCCKYVTKTTTTMTRIDYDGIGCGLSSVKCKHSREEVTTSNDDEDQQQQQSQPKEENRQKQQHGVTNRHRATGSTAIGSATLTTHDSDDKECDSISSRSIFVSDDCDTTSSSTAINPPDESGEGRTPSTSEQQLPTIPEHVATSMVTANARLTSVRVRRKESTDNEETIRPAEEEEEEQQSVAHHPLSNKSTKSPRIPSERIRNKQVKNRRVVVRTEKPRAAGGKKHHDVQMRPAASSKRRKPSALGPPLPPPSMMPLSPPLTTSTSSSSSSSYSGADEKQPPSPAAIPARRKAQDNRNIAEEDELNEEEDEEEEEEEEEQPVEQYSSSANPSSSSSGKAGHVLTPSKIKTRSSTFGYSPPKRTYGPAKLSPKKLPFVSLVKTSFVQTDDMAPAVATIKNGRKKAVINSDSTITTTGNQNRRRKAAENKSRKSSSPSVKKRLIKPKPKQNVVAVPRQKKSREAENTNHDDSATTTTTTEVSGIVGKRNKKLTIKAKQFLARKRVPKLAAAVTTSGHFNNIIDTHASENVVEKDEEDPLLCTTLHTTKENEEEEEQQDRVTEQENHLPTREHELNEEHLEEGDDDGDQHHELVEVEGNEEDLEEELGEEEHYELLELMDVEEVEEEEAEDEGAEEHHEEEEDHFLTHEDETATDPQQHFQHRHQARRNDEERKLVMADHDYSDQHDDNVDHPMVDAEFVEVEELEEHHLEDNGGEEVEEEEEEEQGEHEEDDEDDEEDEEDDDDDESTITTVTAPPVMGFGKQQQQRVKLTFTSTGGKPTVVVTSAEATATSANASSSSTTTTTGTTTTNNSPNKYSP
uniref:DBF4-type domain-containing protein n=1 Tax=Anopheles epiroticus TaxID=199890 RepID=A0A182PLZ2_9DIPT